VPVLESQNVTSPPPTPPAAIVRSAAVSLADTHGLPGGDADSGRQRKRRVGRALLGQRRLQLERRANRLRGRAEHGEHLVAAHLDHLARAGRHGVAGQGRETGR